jgi:hypothetical protein
MKPIESWKDLIYALDAIRQLRKKPRIDKNTDLRFRLSQAEAEVDACIDRKLNEWAKKEQPELIGGIQ